MIENVHRNLEGGMSPRAAAISGARQIGFTVFSISLSLIAAFVPLLFMGGPIGQFLREFSMTIVFAIVVSTVVSLTVTPMISAQFLRPHEGARNTLDAVFERMIGGLENSYLRL